MISRPFWWITSLILFVSVNGYSDTCVNAFHQYTDNMQPRKRASRASSHVWLPWQPLAMWCPASSLSWRIARFSWMPHAHLPDEALAIPRRTERIERTELSRRAPDCRDTHHAVTHLGRTQTMIERTAPDSKVWVSCQGNAPVQHCGSTDSKTSEVHIHEPMILK